MIFGGIWLKWELQHHQIEFAVNHMVDMVHLVQIPADMVVDQAALEDLAVLVNPTFPVLDNTLPSLEQVDQVEIMEHQMVNNAAVKLKALVLLDLMALLVKLDQMVLTAFLVFLVKMVKVLKIFIKNPHLVHSTALLDHPALLDLLVDLVFEECVDLKDHLDSLEMMASLELLENKDHLVHQELMANLDKLEKKETTQKNQLQEKDHVEPLAHKVKKGHKEIKDQLELQANLVRLDLLVLLVFKDLLAQMVNKGVKDQLVQSAKMLNTAPVLIETVAAVDPMVDVEAQVAMAVPEQAIMATMEATVAMLVLVIVEFVFKR